MGKRLTARDVKETEQRLKMKLLFALAAFSTLAEAGKKGKEGKDKEGKDKYGKPDKESNKSKVQVDCNGITEFHYDDYTQSVTCTDGVCEYVCAEGYEAPKPKKDKPVNCLKEGDYYRVRPACKATKKKGGAKEEMKNALKACKQGKDKDADKDEIKECQENVKEQYVKEKPDKKKAKCNKKGTDAKKQACLDKLDGNKKCKKGTE